MCDLSKKTYPYGLNILIVAILIVFSLLAPGLNVGAFISLLVIAYTRKENLTGQIVFIFCLYVVLLSFLIKQNIFYQQPDGWIKWLTITQEPFFIMVFLLIFFTFPHKKLFFYGNTLGLIVVFSLFQEFFIKILVFLAEKKSIDYIHFSIPKEDYLKIVEKASENELAKQGPKAAFKHSIYLFSTYWGAWCAVLNSCFFMVLARFLGRKYLLERFSFRQMLLPKWILSVFLTAWLIFLINIMFDFSAIMDKHFTSPKFLQQIVVFLQKTSTSFLIAISPLFFFQGVSVLIHFFNKMMNNFFEFSKKNFKTLKHFNTFVPILFLLALFFFLKGNKVALLFVIFTTECLGVLEMWFNFRKIS